MGRPKIYEEPRVTTAIRLPVPLHRALQRAATARAISVNLLVTDAVSDYLSGLEPREHRRRLASRRGAPERPEGVVS